MEAPRPSPRAGRARGRRERPAGPPRHPAATTTPRRPAHPAVASPPRRPSRRSSTDEGLRIQTAVRPRRETRPGPGGHRRRAALHEALRQRGAHASGVRQDQPPAGGPGRQRLRLRAGDHQRLQRGRIVRQRRGLVEAVGLEARQPLGRAEQRGIRPPALGVVEEPPALREAEGDVHPARRTGDLEEEQQPAGLEHLPHVRERPPEVPRGVQDVGGHHQVEPPARQALRRRLALQIERLGREPRRLAKPLARAHGEERRHIREEILPTRGPQAREQRGRGAARAAAHLQDAQRPAQGLGQACRHLGRQVVIGSRTRRA